MKLMDGKAVAESYNNTLRLEVSQVVAQGLRPPHLAAILVGDNVASQTYVKNKVKTCEDIGFKSTLYHLESGTSQEELLKLIRHLNNDEATDGILVQLPLPAHIWEYEIILAIDPSKDVDGFHPMNLGMMVINQSNFIPATPRGIMMLLEYYNIDTQGKSCVIIGRSNIVGTPMSILMSRNGNPGNATVTLCHSHTHNLQSICLHADIIIAAIGKPEFVKGNMVREGAVVIDVGINKVDDPQKKKGYKLVGDVDFAEVAPKCSYITPVPKGVGPMTIAALMSNTMKAFKIKYN